MSILCSPLVWMYLQTYSAFSPSKILSVGKFFSVCTVENTRNIKKLF